MIPTSEQRAEWRRLADAATDGPWYAERRADEYYDLTTVYNVFHNGDTMDRDLVAEVAYDNADFIAAARTALPALLDALDAAEAERDEALARIEAAKKARIAGLGRPWWETVYGMDRALDGEVEE